MNRHPSLTGRGWAHINGKCCPVWYAVPATADVLQPQPQGLSGDDDDDGSNEKYGDNNGDCDTGSKWNKKFKQLSLVPC